MWQMPGMENEADAGDTSEEPQTWSAGSQYMVGLIQTPGAPTLTLTLAQVNGSESADPNGRKAGLHLLQLISEEIPPKNYSFLISALKVSNVSKKINSCFYTN